MPRNAVRVPPFPELDIEDPMNKLVRRLNVVLDQIVANQPAVVEQVVESVTQVVQQLVPNSQATSALGSSSSGLTLGGFIFNEPLIGAKNGSNIDFTCASLVAIGDNGKPNASVWNGGPSLYSATNPPPPGRWTLIESGMTQTWRMGDAPLADTELVVLVGVVG